MFNVDLGDGYFVVPRDAVTLNGLYLPQLNTAPEAYTGPFVLLMPNGQAAMGEDGRRPYVHRSLDDCRENKETLLACETGQLEATPALAHAGDLAITAEWLDTAFEWYMKITYPTNEAVACYGLQISDDTLLFVNANGLVWVQHDTCDIELALGQCRSRKQLCDLVQALRNIA